MVVAFIKLENPSYKVAGEKGILNDDVCPQETKKSIESRVIRDVKIITTIQMCFEFILIMILTFELYGIHLIGNNLDNSSCQTLCGWTGGCEFVEQDSYYFESSNLIFPIVGFVWAGLLFMLINTQDYKNVVTTRAVGTMLGIYVSHLTISLLTLPFLCGSSSMVSFVNVVMSSMAIRLYIGLVVIIILARLLAVIKGDWAEPEPTKLSSLLFPTKNNNRRKEIPGIIAGVKMTILFMTCISTCTFIYLIGRRTYNGLSFKETSFEYFDNWVSSIFTDTKDEVYGILVDNSWEKDVLLWLGCYALVCLISTATSVKMWKSYGDAKTYDELTTSDAHKYIEILLFTLFVKGGLIIWAAKMAIYELTFVLPIEVAQGSFVLLAIVLLIGIVVIKKKGDGDV